MLNAVKICCYLVVGVGEYGGITILVGVFRGHDIQELDKPVVDPDLVQESLSAECSSPRRQPVNVQTVIDAGMAGLRLSTDGGPSPLRSQDSRKPLARGKSSDEHRR